ncbi:hypothetical protein [Lewinella sp. IMCC34183]|uniref:hypothetical protein n=1 Tax=Lewinella sp. IMCC34183 TaxID=2248762 RepID=UPI000E275331|nr:hypothetical protein [Lewinella sp. IMCC34183]
MKLLLLPLFALSLFRTAGCGDENPDTVAPALTDCGPAIRVRNPLPRLTTDDFRVVEASADGLCLSVTLSATGCSSQAWKVTLWAEGEPGDAPGGILIFDDGVGENEMTCQAIVEETYTFDLTPYLGDGPRPATFGLPGSEVTVELR